MSHVRRGAAVVLAATARCVGGCSRSVEGMPLAAPGPTGTELLSTTCRQYTEMNNSDRREVIGAIGEAGNQLVAMNPDLWVGVAAALCPFAAASAPVKDVVTGGIR